MFLRKDVLKICSKFTEEHPCCRSVISIKLLYKFWKFKWSLCILRNYLTRWQLFISMLLNNLFWIRKSLLFYCSQFLLLEKWNNKFWIDYLITLCFRRQIHSLFSAIYILSDQSFSELIHWSQNIKMKTKAFYDLHWLRSNFATAGYMLLLADLNSYWYYLFSPDIIFITY